MVRLMATFTVHDRFDNSLDNLIDFASLIKSPIELTDAWLKAVIRSKVPLSFQLVKERYWNSL